MSFAGSRFFFDNAFAWYRVGSPGPYPGLRSELVWCFEAKKMRCQYENFGGLGILYFWISLRRAG